MSLLITILVVLIVAGLFVYIVNLLPIDATFKRVAQAIVVVVVVIYVLLKLTALVNLP